MSTYRSTTHTAAGQLSAEDDRKLRAAVASGANFQDIKDTTFSDRFDLSPQILQDRAREIGAEWSPAEDVILIESLELPLKMDDHRYLDRVQARLREGLREQGVFSPSRSIEDIKARTKNLIKVGENYYLRNPPAEASSPYILAPPTINPDYRTPNTSSSQPGTVSQSLMGPSSRSAQGYDNPQAVSQPVLDHASGGSKPGSSVAGRRQVKPRFDDQWTHENLDLIKVKMARCYSLSHIARDFSAKRKAKDIESILAKIGYEDWSDEQDDHLLELQQYIGDNWAEIRNRLSGPERHEAEIQGRFKYLSELPPNLNKHRRKRPHEYTKEDDAYICCQVARDTTYKSICQERFPNVFPHNLEKRAEKIGAPWSEDDNQKLRDEVLRYGHDNQEVDWVSIGKQYEPPRHAEAVQIRWRHLRGVL
ncbi:hypothetical protein SLS63_009566 [Diaporthe eres]|uniref:Myb-like domain-containing protein n=1 Tax=Diaporthe eres TaxID=83184 RepID=A0ABR1NZA5_DIAER